MEPLLSEKESSSQTSLDVHQKDENVAIKSDSNETEDSVGSKTYNNDPLKIISVIQKQ